MEYHRQLKNPNTRIFENTVSDTSVIYCDGVTFNDGKWQ